MERKDEIIVRFPPSPTGLLHMGNVRTALYNYLFTRKNGGKFLIRVEDTDRTRSKKEYEEDMFDSMKWLNLEHDNVGSEWRQTERTDVYKKYLDKLLTSGAAYISEETEGQNKEVVRFKNPGGKIKFEDLIRGEVEIDVTDLGDFIIARNVNEPLYHLAVVIDDLESEITHIIRGEDHISNTPRQILIWRAIAETSNIELRIPTYAHLPMILAEDKSKLSKRKHGEAVSLKYYREKGYEPEAILNFMALIGWNPGTEQEIFSLPELVESFDLSKVQKKGGIFNIEKLDWINREHILRQPKELKIERLKIEKEKTKFKDSEKWGNSDFVEKFLKLTMDRIHRWGEVSEMLEAGEWDYLFDSPTLSPSLLAWKKSTPEDAKEKISHITEWIKANSPSSEELSVYLEAYATKTGKGEVLWPIRYSLSGKEKSPDPFSLIDILGVEETLIRLESALKV